MGTGTFVLGCGSQGISWVFKSLITLLMGCRNPVAEQQGNHSVKVTLVSENNYEKIEVMFI